MNARTRFPEFIRFLIFHAGIGFAVSLGVTVLILVTDFSSIGTLVAGSPDGPFMTIIMVLLMGITFSSVQISAAIMLKADRASDDDPDDGPGSGTHELVPVKVSNRSRRR